MIDTHYLFCPNELTKSAIYTGLWVNMMIRRPNKPFTPPTDILELDDRLIIQVEVAGMRASQFEITLLEQRLIISGMRERLPVQKCAFHQVEIAYGEFLVAVDLPWKALRDDVRASYAQGFLQLELPRRSAGQVDLVELNTEGQEEIHDE